MYLRNRSMNPVDMHYLLCVRFKGILYFPKSFDPILIHPNLSAPSQIWPQPLHNTWNPSNCEHLFMFLKYFQLPCRTGPQTTHSRVNEEQIKVCLIQISRYRFSLVIAGLTKILQKINEMVSISVHCSSIYSRGCASTRVTSSPNSTRVFKKKSSNEQI